MYDGDTLIRGRMTERYLRSHRSSLQRLQDHIQGCTIANSALNAFVVRSISMLWPCDPGPLAVAVESESNLRIIKHQVRAWRRDVGIRLGTSGGHRRSMELVRTVGDGRTANCSIYEAGSTAPVALRLGIDSKRSIVSCGEVERALQFGRS